VKSASVEIQRPASAPERSVAMRVPAAITRINVRANRFANRFAATFRIVLTTGRSGRI
jgi:hypothetical protein